MKRIITCCFALVTLGLLLTTSRAQNVYVTDYKWTGNDNHSQA